MLVKTLCVVTRCRRQFLLLKVKPNCGLMGNIIKNLYHLQGLMKRFDEKFFEFPKLPIKENKGGHKGWPFNNLGLKDL